MSDLGCDPGLLTSFSVMFLFILGLGNNFDSLVRKLGPGCYKILGSFLLSVAYVPKDS